MAITLHMVLSPLEHQESFVRMLLINYSSAFNTIIPDILVSKLSDSPMHQLLDYRLPHKQTPDSQTWPPPLL